MKGVDTPERYRLLDCGLGRRLESFGDLVVDRPAPTADRPRRAPGLWTDAITYRSGRGWATPDGLRPDRDTVDVTLAGVVMAVRLGPGGQVGLFPEHAANAGWLSGAVAARIETSPGHEPQVLNLFAHSGLLTLVAASAGAGVTHVDASRPAVQAARTNAERSGLAEHPIRWIVDDAVDFVLREGRRGRRYAGLIADPPSYGHGAHGTRGDSRGWQFEPGIDALLDACRAITEPDAFWILSTHTSGWPADRLAAALERHSERAGAHAEALELAIEAESGASLHLGVTARLDPRRRDSR